MEEWEMSDLIERLKRLEDVLLDQCRGNEGHPSFYAAEVVHRAAEQIESLTSENTRLRALLENREQRLKDTEFLYNGYFVLATEAGKRPGSAELSAAARRFDEVLDDAVNSALAIKEKIE